MNSVNKTLYIPLYGKALVSRKGIILEDKTAEQIWDMVQFPLKAKSRSKWLAYYMSMRAKVFDDWLESKIAAFPEAVVLHLGCGLDSRNLRVGVPACIWYDVDFPQVIEERKKYFRDEDHYRMIGVDVTDPELLLQIPSADTALIVMEGISMYLTPEELTRTLTQLARHFPSVHLLMDCYTEFAAKASKVKNPINDVGVNQVYGLDDPTALQSSGLRFVREHPMTPETLIDQLQGMEKTIFQKLFAGSFAKKMYRLYEYQTD